MGNEDPVQPIQRGGYKGWKVLVMTGIWEEGGKEERTPLAGRTWEGFLQEGAVEWEDNCSLNCQWACDGCGGLGLGAWEAPSPPWLK